MMRHGQSKWNELNLFTGWVDVPLSTKGIEEALEGGKKIRNFPIDIIITTTLVRAQMSAFLAISVPILSGKVPVVLHPGEGRLKNGPISMAKKLKKIQIPVIRCWELNERMYGELQGLNKAETAEKFGAEQVKIWRRSYDTRPPEGESLEMTAARLYSLFQRKNRSLSEARVERVYFRARQFSPIDHHASRRADT